MALAISLVLMVAMTILGVATLSGTRLNEKITSNAQQKAMAFEVAESAIRSVWNQATLKAAITDPDVSLNDPEPIDRPDIDAELSTAYDQMVDSRGTNIEGSVTVQYCGEGPARGTSLNADESDSQRTAGLLVDVNGLSAIANTGTRSDHVQRALIVGPRTGRTGNCVIR